MRSGSWYRRVAEKIRPLTLAHLARAGLTLPVAARKHFSLLNAKQPITYKGKITATVDNGTVQTQALENYYRVLGVLGKVAGDAPAEGELGNRVRIVINHPPASAQARRGPLTIRVPRPEHRGEDPQDR